MCELQRDDTEGKQTEARPEGAIQLPTAPIPQGYEFAEALGKVLMDELPPPNYVKN